MKLTIFLEWICVQILSTQCDAFLNQLNASDVATKVGIQKTIDHLFSYDDTLSLILDNNVCEEAIFEMNTTRPYISLNLDTVEDIQLHYEGQFIICPVDINSLSRTVYKMQYQIAARYGRTLSNSKILVIANMTYVFRIFEMLWTYSINNVIALIYGQGILKLYMCDRYSPENACGETANLLISQNCDEQLTFSFTNMVYQMNKCPIKFIYTNRDIYANEKKYPSARYVLYVIQELSNRCNATFQRVPCNSYRYFDFYVNNKTNIVMTWVAVTYPQYTVTEPLVRINIAWLVPKAEQISNMNAFVQVFKWNVWVAVGVTLICASLTWFLIISCNGRFTFERLGLAFINVWSLTICGCIAQFPRSFALRIILLTYLIYVIHIQCALTSNMATILTTPRYGFQIRNLEELAESGLHIYILQSVKITFLNLNDSNHTLYTRLQKQLHPVSHSELDRVFEGFNHYRNCAIFSSAEDLRSIEMRLSQKINVYQIYDNSITGIFTIRLALLKDHYFAPTLNSLLSKMVESGIGDKLKNDFNSEHFGNNDSMEEISEILTLPHLTFIFIFLGLGLSISCVVFCLEHVVHKFL